MLKYCINARWTILNFIRKISSSLCSVDAYLEYIYFTICSKIFAKFRSKFLAKLYTPLQQYKKKKTESSLNFCLDGLRTENVSFFLICSNDDIELYSRLKQNNIIFHMYLCMQVCCIHSFVIPTRDKELHTILGISESLWAGAGNLSCTMLNKVQFFIT